MNKSECIQALKPKTSKRYLLFLAAFFWSYAGGMLIFKSLMILPHNMSFPFLRMTASILAGLLFYRFVFSKISKKHVMRITHLSNNSPCLFSFFNVKSYVLMTIMIFSGLALRKSGLVPAVYLSMFYLAMGIPLLLSSFRFYYSGIHYHSFI
ncbi:MAG: hypothetical protein CVT92_04885 [Bacteroidetes bacterium HGW-Bacteroidetes-1]|jgi:hypothetical protein|nr:MAG: hypothetical protein CVT92_04885 [Bacteroidetes bacterium HGW-Bacteroidetes-1]